MATEDTTATAISQLDTIISTEEANQSVARAQKAALESQVNDLRQQIAVLDRFIANNESLELKRARRLRASFGLALTAQGRELLRRFASIKDEG